MEVQLSEEDLNLWLSDVAVPDSAGPVSGKECCKKSLQGSHANHAMPSQGIHREPSCEESKALHQSPHHWAVSPFVSEAPGVTADTAYRPVNMSPCSSVVWGCPVNPPSNGLSQLSLNAPNGRGSRRETDDGAAVPATTSASTPTASTVFGNQQRTHASSSQLAATPADGVRQANLGPVAFATLAQCGAQQTDKNVSSASPMHLSQCSSHMVSARATKAVLAAADGAIEHQASSRPRCVHANILGTCACICISVRIA